MATKTSMILARLATPLATPSGNRERLREVTRWRRRESNPLDGISDESGLEASSADSAAEQVGSEGSASYAIGVETGMSPLRCSNVANLLTWALEGLASGDVERVRAALGMALDLVSKRPDEEPR
jgi:hypothetical protein